MLRKIFSIKKRIISLFIILLPFISKGVDISNINIRSSIKQNYPTTIYLNIENDSNQLDYLLNIEVMEQPQSSATINKTVIEQNVARIIKIDRLAIPAHSKIKLAPLGIYIVINKLLDTSSIKLKFTFKHAGEVITITKNKNTPVN